jgi:hypothetical protein
MFANLNLNGGGTMKRLTLTLVSVAVLGAVFAVGYYAGLKGRADVSTVMAAPAPSYYPGTKEPAGVPTVMTAPTLDTPDNLGGSWQINANGNPGTMTLNQDSGGVLSGLVNTGGGGLGQFLIGFYSRRDGRVVFLRVIPDFSSARPNDIVRNTAARSQVFLGNAFTSGSQNHITGAFFNFSPQAEGGGSSDQFNFGWLAQK